MDKILFPLEWAVAWVMWVWHWIFTTLGLPDGPGTAWVLSIVGLTVFIRVCLTPLFFKQIHASRGMQIVQPEIKAIQAKYKNKKDSASREAMSRETMAAYKKHGTNPFASCLPILLQAPIFFALFRVLNNLRNIANGDYRIPKLGPIDATIAGHIEQSRLFGASLSDYFMGTFKDDFISGNAGEIRLVSAILIVAMATTQYLTQRQLTMKNMPPSALEGPMAQTQKLMMYGMPVVMGISGINFPVGVLIYWTTTNIWSSGQQFYTIRNIPTPGSEAERKLNERKAARAAAKGIVLDADKPMVIEPRTGQREQPKRNNRKKRKR